MRTHYRRQRPVARLNIDLHLGPAPKAPIRFEDLFTQAKATNVLDLRGIGSLLRPTTTQALVPMPSNFGLTARPAPMPYLPPPRRFPVASEATNRPDVGLPYGISRFVRASTLKRIAGGNAADQLLRRTPAGWAFVANDDVIDLTDVAQVFKLGKLAIFS